MILRELSNTQLVKLCAEDPGNKDAWAEFSFRFDARIKLIVYREAQNKSLLTNTRNMKQFLEDLVQDVYLKLIANDCRLLKAFKGVSENSIFSYLGIVAINLVRNYATSQKTARHFVLENSIDKELLEPYFSIDNEKDLSFEALKQEIEKILDNNLMNKDKERDKLIFKLFFYEGFSVEDIASELFLSPLMVKKLLANIKSRLRQKLASEPSLKAEL